MGQLYAKNGLIRGSIPKISPKNNLKKKKKKTSYRLVIGTPILTKNRVLVPIAQNKEPGYPDSSPNFDKKSGNWTGLTSLVLANN
jgi:hypothetical protein